ncbi:TPA: hypothetical protein U5E40_004384 [Yersinia enterocolitica]|nr:hypothetical protein [Yersinia enterocolitica]HEI6959184.1 hypothetical protein [Yersinia enterocolitica]HEN3639668.1 hypothetical protein [Yersinia enterocolitica]
MSKIGSISLRCLFCQSALEGPEDAEYQSGDLIKCAACGEKNDFDSVMEVAKEEGLELAKSHVDKMLKGLFK